MFLTSLGQSCCVSKGALLTKLLVCADWIAVGQFELWGFKLVGCVGAPLLSLSPVGGNPTGSGAPTWILFPSSVLLCLGVLPSTHCPVTAFRCWPLGTQP